MAAYLALFATRFLRFDRRVRAAKHTLFCLAENRREGEASIRFALASLLRQCPGAAVLLFLSDPSPEIERWLLRFPTVQLRREDWPRELGWNCKAAVLLAALETGADEAVWLDGDLIVSGDLRAWLSTLEDDVLGAAQEVLVASRQGTLWRTRAWGLPPGREIGCTVNTCVIRVTARHRDFLRRWQALLTRPDYRGWQCRPIFDRPFHMVGDQDAFNALLGTAETAGLRLQLLKSGRDIVHNGTTHCFGFRERLARLGRRKALLVHAMDRKPWRIPFCPRPDLGFWLFNILDVEVSAYVAHARSLRAEVGEAYPWLERRSWSARAMVALGLGHDALRGLPYALGCDLARRSGFNRVAERLGLKSRL